MDRSGHVDTFARDNLPPPERWPEFLFELPELQFEPRLNCAVELLDRAVERGWGDRDCVLGDGVRWSYAELLGQANRIARVLVDDMGLVSGNRVLLRGANSPMLAACWFGVVKAGGIAVGTMPMLRARELTTIVHKAQATHALCDAKLAQDLQSALSACPGLRQVVFYNDDGSLPGRFAGTRGTAAGALRRRRHRARRCLPDRFHVGHHRPAQGHDAFPSRRDGRLRLLAAARAAAKRR